MPTHPPPSVGQRQHASIHAQEQQCVHLQVPAMQGVTGSLVETVQPFELLQGAGGTRCPSGRTRSHAMQCCDISVRSWTAGIARQRTTEIHPQHVTGAPALQQPPQ